MTRLRELKESLAWIDDPTMTDGADPAARHWATECRSLLSDLERARALVERIAQHPCIRRQAEFGGNADNPNCSQCYSCEARAFLQEQEPSE
jgi:hypothetical protein